MIATIEQPVTGDSARKFSPGPLDEELEFLWEARSPSGAAYDFYLGRISRNPVLRNQATGKYFMLPWSRIIELAEANALDES